jgi:PEP-CTERM motif
MKLKNLASMLVAIAATATLFATPAEATLLGRDINGYAVAGSDASAVFLYDTHLDITWLRDANASATAGNTNDPYGYGIGGYMDWDTANNWAKTLTVGAFSGWRLPTSLQPDAACTHQYAFDTLGPQSGGWSCTGSEMGHLWYTELGNKGLFVFVGLDLTVQPGWGLTNTGSFQNLQPDNYWTGTDHYPPHNDNNYLYAWIFNPNNGDQYAAPKDAAFLAMAVRPGDVFVASVPEPGTLALAVAALVGIGIVRQRRRAAGASAL